jgi:multimeric flavodoxin WrbA
MPVLLVVHHTPSPGMQAMLEAVRAGSAEAALGEELDVVLRPALAASVVDVLGADAVVLGTPANIGYMSGALKYFFDTVYCPVLEATRGRGYGLYVHGNNDTGGTVRGVESIATGLGWRRLRPPVEVIGDVGAAGLADCRDLGGLAALAALERV